MDPRTVDIYQRHAGEWSRRRGPAVDDFGSRFRAMAGPGLVLDAGCGSGRHLERIGRPVVGLDATAAMLGLAAGGHPLVRGDLESLPFAGGSLTGIYARHSYLHLPKERVGASLAEVRRVLRPGGLLLITLIEGTYEGDALESDDFPGRWFSFWAGPELRATLEGAGFRAVVVESMARPRRGTDLVATARR